MAAVRIIANLACDKLAPVIDWILGPAADLDANAGDTRIVYKSLNDCMAAGQPGSVIPVVRLVEFPKPSRDFPA